MNHSQRKTGPILSESFSSDVLHSILGSPTDTVVQALNEAFDEAKIDNITHSTKNMLKKFFNHDFIIDYQEKFGVIRSNLRRLLSLKMIGASDYAIYNTPNGKFALRIADHNANGNNFKQDDAKINISVFVAFKEYNVPESKVEYIEYKIRPDVFNANKQIVIEALINAVAKTLYGGDFFLDETIAEKRHYNVNNLTKESASMYNKAYLKKSMYESLINDIAKIVKKAIIYKDK